MSAYQPSKPDQTLDTPYARPTEDKPEEDSRLGKETESREELEQGLGERIFIGGLDPSIQKEDVERLFKETGYKAVSIESPLWSKTHPKSMPNGAYCWAQMFSIEHAVSAVIHLDGQRYLGRSLRVEIATPHPRSLSLYHDTLSETKKLFVNLLPPHSMRGSKDEVAELFKEFGVNGVRRRKDFAWVTFHTSDGAKAAKESVDRTLAFGGRLNVEFTK